MDHYPAPHTPDPDGIGLRIREARERHGWSVSQLALRCDCTAETIRVYESGRIGTGGIGGTILSRLSLALGLTTDEILGVDRLRKGDS